MSVQNAIKENSHYTYADYLSWDDNIRRELIDGVIYMMAPPNRRHQRVSGELFKQLAVFLTGKSCEVYHAPFGVRLNAAEGDDNVVEPDIVVVCDKSKLDDMGCVGAPDMIVEILSPSTSAYDKWVKFNKYLRAGVREYWIVDPADHTVNAYVLENGKYTVQVYGDTDTPTVHVLDGCAINLSEIFT